MTTEDTSQTTRSPLAKALASLFEVKLGETIENGFIKSIGQLQRILILFVLMGVFSAATVVALIVLTVAVTYFVTESAEATAIAAICISAISLVLTVLFFMKVLSQTFWFNIFHIHPPAPEISEPAQLPDTSALK